MFAYPSSKEDSTNIDSEMGSYLSSLSLYEIFSTSRVVGNSIGVVDVLIME